MQGEDGGIGQVDPWRFTGGFLKTILSGRIPEEPSHPEIPWTPVSKPLSESKVALLSTAGLSMRGDPPFDMDIPSMKSNINDWVINGLGVVGGLS